MSAKRITKGLKRGAAFSIQVDGENISAFEGETIAAALLAAGRQTLRRSPKHNEPRGVFCGIGLCHDCLMKVNGVANVRTCQTLASPQTRVETQK